MHRLRTFLLAGALALAVITSADLVGVLDPLERDTVDLRFSLRPDHRPNDIAVVAVDDLTFSDLRKQWPFPRSYFGDVIDRLHDAGAREVVFDIQFTEQSSEAEDLALYRAIERAGGAVLATSETNDRGEHRIFGGEENLRAIGATGAASNLPDEDSGVIRRFNYAVDGLKTLAVKVAEREGRKLDPARFHGEAGAWIDFRGGPLTIPTFSFSDVYRGRVDAQRFAGKVVVIGASAPTLQDVHPTSTARAELMSGPEIQANAIWTALHGLPLRDVPAVVNWLAIALLSFVVPLISMRLNPLAAGLTGAALAAAYAGLAYLLFTQGYTIAVVAPLLGCGVATTTTAVAGQVIDRLERRRVDAHNEELEVAVRERTADLDALQLEIIERLGQAVDSRDEETGEHINRIGSLSYALAREIGWDEHHAETLRRASAMHDVGKIAIPDSILQHPGPLSKEQWVIMKTHTTAGAKILSGSRSPLVRMGELIALTHHEKWNGQGYPNGLSGDDIPIEGRIVAVCDVYDALVSKRPYKEPWTPEEALEEIAKCAGSHFDPMLAEAFVSMMERSIELRVPLAA